MYLSPELVAKWKTLYQSGDKVAIAEDYIKKHTSVKKNTVQGWLVNVFKFNYCPDNLFPFIDSYYKDVEKKLNKIK